MSTSHALVWLDHHHAKVMSIGAQTHQVTQLHDPKHDTGQHNSAVRTQHEFFAVDHPTDGEPVALATKFFHGHDRRMGEHTLA